MDHIHYKELSPDEKNEVVQKDENRNKERARVLKREYRKNLSAEKKKEIAQKQQEYLKNLTPEKKEEKKQKRIQYYKNLSPDKKKEKLQKDRENRRKAQAKERDKKYRHEYWKKLSHEKKEEKKIKVRGYYQKLSPEKKEQKLQRDRENRKKRFCHKCQKKFWIKTDLFKHIIKHVTLPSIIVPRIEHKRAFIKKESENVELSNSFHNDIPQNIVYIKTERFEYNEDIEPELNNVKTENGVSFYGKESQNNGLHTDISQNVINIKMEYDKDIQPELNNTFVNIKTENEIEIDNVSFYDCIKTETQDINNDLLTDLS